MNSIGISAIVFGCVFGGAIVGKILRAILPEHHLSDESKDVVKLGMGLVATMCALVLGLLVSSAKTYHDTQSDELTDMSAKVVMLDRLLAHYGPETNEARGMLRSAVSDALSRLRGTDSSKSQQSAAPTGVAEVLLDKIQELSPKDERQRALQTQAASLMIDIGRMRWLQYVQRANSVSVPLLVMLVFWLTAIFMSFGVFAPTNGTVLTSLLVAALSVSGAALLILELYTPYSGIIQISSTPLSEALAQLGKW